MNERMSHLKKSIFFQSFIGIAIYTISFCSVFICLPTVKFLGHALSNIGVLIPVLMASISLGYLFKVKKSIGVLSLCLSIFFWWEADSIDFLDFMLKKSHCNNVIEAIDNDNLQNNIGLKILSNNELEKSIIGKVTEKIFDIEDGDCWGTSLVFYEKNIKVILVPRICGREFDSMPRKYFLYTNGQASDLSYFLNQRFDVEDFSSLRNIGDGWFILRMKNGLPQREKG